MSAFPESGLVCIDLLLLCLCLCSLVQFTRAMRLWSSSARTSGIGKWGEGVGLFLKEKVEERFFVLERQNGVFVFVGGILCCLVLSVTGGEEPGIGLGQSVQRSLWVLG